MYKLLTTKSTPFYVNNIPTEEEKAKRNPWIFSSTAQQDWAQCYRSSPSQRTQKTRSLVIMLPKKIRLTTSLFDQVFKTGRVQHGSFFWMRSLPISLELPSRFAVVVPKKVAKTAVLRNKIKRIVYRAIEEAKEDISVGPSSCMSIFGVKSDISKIPFAEIAKEVKSLGVSMLKSGQK